MLPEIQDTLASLAGLRGQMAAIVAATPLAGLNWRPSLPPAADETNSLAVLAVHSAGAEHFWFAEGIAAQPPTRQRAAEFSFVAQSAEQVLQALQAAAAESEPILAALSATRLDETLTFNGRTRSVRGILQHVLAHYAMHLGHMQLTYQLWAEGKAFAG